jgi:hypothetical protein
MIEGTKKMELDAKEGRGYSSGIRMRDENKDRQSEEKKRKKKRARTETANDNQLTRTTRTECKCGGSDHKRITSLRCPWRGLSKVEVAQNYEKRKSEIIVPPVCDENPVDSTTEPTSEATEKDPPVCDENPVDPTTEPTSEATEKEKREAGNCKEHVQSSSKYFGASSKITK